MIGQMDQQITLQSCAEVSDGAGGVSRTWSNISSAPVVWAKVAYLSGGEGDLNDRTNAQATVTFEIHNRSDLDERMRIVCNGRAYNIRAVHYANFRNLFLKIETDRGVPL